MNVHAVCNRYFVAAEKPQLSRLDAIVSLPQRRTRARCMVPRYQRSRARVSKQSIWRRAASTTSSGTSTASAFATFCSVVGGSAFVHDYRVFVDSDSDFKPVCDRSVEDATKCFAIWYIRIHIIQLFVDTARPALIQTDQIVGVTSGLAFLASLRAICFLGECTRRTSAPRRDRRPHTIDPH